MSIIPGSTNPTLCTVTLVAALLEIESMEAKTAKRLSDDDLDVVIRIGRARAAIAMRMKEALERDDDEAALALAREYCGLEPKEVTHAR